MSFRNLCLKKRGLKKWREGAAILLEQRRRFAEVERVFEGELRRRTMVQTFRMWREETRNRRRVRVRVYRLDSFARDLVLRKWWGRWRGETRNGGLPIGWRVYDDKYDTDIDLRFFGSSNDTTYAGHFATDSFA